MNLIKRTRLWAPSQLEGTFFRTYLLFSHDSKNMLHQRLNFQPCRPSVKALSSTNRTRTSTNQNHLHRENFLDCLALLCHCFMREWCLGCWPPSQDWPNTRWTSNWPETCSWRQRSGSRTDLLKKEFPLYLIEMKHMVSAQTRVTAVTAVAGGACAGSRCTVPWWSHCVLLSLASRLSVCDGSRDVWERLMSTDSCSKLWKLFLQKQQKLSMKPEQTRIKSESHLMG